MRLFQALWPFGKADSVADDDKSGTGTSSNLDVVSPVVVDAVSVGIGDVPSVTGAILCEPYAPSKLVRDDDETTPVTTRGKLEFVWPAETHARELLSALLQWGYAGQELPYARVKALYETLCARLGWECGGWNPVGAALRRLTGGKKLYRWFRLSNGELHRLRVYAIPMALPAQRSVGAPTFAEVRSAA